VDLAERSARAAASLSKYLLPVAFTDWSAFRVTAELTQRVVSWGVDHGWRVRREVPSIAGLPGARPDRSGYLDVVCERLNAPPIVIEIDRTDKQWSSRKLLCEADAGAVAIWVRWNDANTWIVPAPVAVIRLPTTSRPDRGGGRRLYSRDMPVGLSLDAGQRSAVPSQRSPLRSTLKRDEQVVSVESSTRPCAATTNKGRRCPIAARPSGLCHVHDPAVQCGGIKKNGQRCGNATGGGRCKMHQGGPSFDDAPTLL
jgi:hypothetical protein